MEPFVVKHYSEDERPTIKGNGFDGLEIGRDREEAEEFVAFVNSAVAAEREACAQIVDVKQGVEAWEIHGGQETIDVLRDLAAAIRARSNV